MNKLYTVRRHPSHRNYYCVWYEGNYKNIPENNKTDKPKYLHRVVRTEELKADAIFWSNSFNEGNGWKEIHPSTTEKETHHEPQ